MELYELIQSYAFIYKLIVKQNNLIFKIILTVEEKFCLFSNIRKHMFSI